MNTRKRLPEGAVILLALAFALVLLLSGCKITFLQEEQEEQDAEHQKRFTSVAQNGSYLVIQDTETGVQYVSSGYGGLCVVVNADGTPYTGE